MASQTGPTQQVQKPHWSPEEYAELGELLTKLSRALLGENADRHLISTKTTAPTTPAADG